MHIDVAFTAAGAEEGQLHGSLVCVIDVLRASSSITAALAAGAAAVWPVAQVEEARTQRDLLAAEGYRVLLAGERDAVPPPGFDLGNSPREFRADVVAGKHVVLTTTNGTQALARAVAAGAKRIYVAAFVNLEALVERLQADIRAGVGSTVLLYAAGTQGRVSLEDTVCAGLIVRELSLRNPSVTLTDAARIALHAYVGVAPRWREALFQGDHARNLIEKGFRLDVEWCLRVGITPTIGHWQDGRITCARA